MSTNDTFHLRIINGDIKCHFSIHETLFGISSSTFMDMTNYRLIQIGELAVCAKKFNPQMMGEELRGELDVSVSHASST